MKSIIKILISALFILSATLLPVSAVESESTDAAWMDKLSSSPEGEYEKMVDGDLKTLDIWLVDSNAGYVSSAENGITDFYESNMSFFEKYVPEERRESNVFVSRYVPNISVQGTAAEAEYYCRLDEVESVIVCGEVIATDSEMQIVRPITPNPGPVIWRFDSNKTVAEVKEAYGKDVAVMDADGNVMSVNEVAGTGCYLIDGDQRYNLSILGDINGDGMVSTVDYLGLVTSITTSENFESVYMAAADINGDNTISAADCLAMKASLRK